MKPWFFLMVLFCAGVLHASEAQLKEGNRFFWRGKYEEALKKYNDALIDTPNSSILRFNAGDAAYQMGDFSAAVKQYEEVGAKAADLGLQSAAHYNRGNALFRQNQWKEAVDAYKAALRINPNDVDAKYNLGIALNVLKNPSQAPSQPQSGKGKKDKQKGSQKKDGKGSDDKQQAQRKPGDMSKEDAERLLSAAGSGEPKKPNTKAASAGEPHPDEDW